MSDPTWRAGRAALRRWLVKLLPQTDWVREFLREVDRDLARRARTGSGPRLTFWYLRQLLSPSTIGFARAVRTRRRGGHTTARGVAVMAGWLMDARQAWRGVVRDRWQALLVVLTLAIGIGSFAAMHGLGRRLFLGGPPHVEAPQQIVRIFLRFDDAAGRRALPWAPYLTASAIRDGVAAFDRASIYRFFDDLADFGDRARPVIVSEVDDRYFGVLGPRPVTGRFIRPGDVGVAVIAAAVAVEEFGSPEAALGRTLRIGQRSTEVIGVAPAGFAGPDLGRIDAWIPLQRDRAGSTNWLTIGRLAVDGRRSAARSQAEAIHQSVDPGRFFQWAREGRIEMAGVHDDMTGERSAETSIAGLLLAVVVLVLVISWINVLNLLLARVTGRRVESLVRLALGIGRWRLVRLLLTESLLLSLLGGLLSLPVAYGEGVLVRTVLLPGVAWPSSVLDADLMVVTFLTVLASGALLGILPARQASRADLAGGLSALRQGPSKRQTRLQTTLAIGQVTFSAALLLCAGLFIKSFWTMRVTDLGVDASGVYVVNLRSLEFRLGGGDEREEAQYGRALDALREGKDGRRAALSVGLPFFTNFGMSIHLDGRDSIPDLPGGGPFMSAVSDGYFDTIGTRIIRGVEISARDVAAGARVIVVGAATAEVLWPARDPIGQCVRIGASTDPCYRVVGVAEDVHRSGYREPPSMQFYLPLGASHRFRGPVLLVRSRSLFASTLSAEISRAVPAADFVEVRRLDTFLDPEIRPWKLGAVMLSMVALLAIAMSVAGVLGVLSYVVARRRREIGVRMALGATRGSIRRLVLRQGIGLGLAGVTIGFAGVLAASRWLGPLLFETHVTDPLVMVAVGLGLMAAAVIACLLPAGQAARVDPIASLRADGG